MKTKQLLTIIVVLSGLNMDAQIRYEPIHIAPYTPTTVVISNFYSQPNLTSTLSNAVTITPSIQIDKNKWVSTINANGEIKNPVDITVKDNDKNTTYNFKKVIVVAKDTSGLREKNHTEGHHGDDTIYFDKSEGEKPDVATIDLNKNDNNPPILTVTGQEKPKTRFPVKIIIPGIVLIIVFYFFLKKTNKAKQVN
jgi:hypothetical protein